MTATMRAIPRSAGIGRFSIGFPPLDSFPSGGKWIAPVANELFPPVADDLLKQSVQYVQKLSPTRLEQLRRLGIETVGDLLFHFPRTYEDLTDVRPIPALKPGSVQTVQGEVVEIEGRRTADGRAVVSIVLSDGKNCIEAVWFHQEYLSRRFGDGACRGLRGVLAGGRRDRGARLRAPILVVSPQIDAHIRRLFPCRLTQDQDRAVADVCRDLASDRPMQRLLQADVGAGKTAVAVYALLATVANKHQAVLMAPTEVLAQQHSKTLEGYLSHSRVRRLLLTGGLTPKERRAALEAIRSGQADLVVGTQALLQDDVQFARLGLVGIDEHHT